MRTYRNLNVVATVMIIYVCNVQSAGAQSTFIGFNEEIDGGAISICYTVSADGRAVGVGIASGSPTDRYRWFVWYAAGKLYQMPMPSSYPIVNDIFALSADGTVVAGRLTAPVLNVQPAYRHVVGEGSTYALLGNTNYAGAPVVSGSDDLRTIAFNDLPFPYYPPEPAYLWREGQPILAIYPLPGGVINRVVSVSGDGRVLVGGDWAENTPAWRWTEEEGIQSIGYLPGGLVAAVATACSSDGSIIAGYSSSENWGGDRASREAFLWTAQAGMRGLGDLPGGRVVSKPTDMSADGSVIVGYGETGVGTIFGVDAFIWDQAHGMRNLRDVLVNEYGLASALEGWRLTDAWAISADGRVIAGNGINPAGQHDAWVVYLDGRPPPDCRADFNRNGMVNSQDFFDFLTDFFTAAPRADYNGDGAITSQDFLDYLAAFFAGC